MKTMLKVSLAVLCALVLAGCGNRGFRFTVKAQVGYPNATYYLTPIGQPSNFYMKATSDSEGYVCFSGRSRYPMALSISDGCAKIVEPVFVEEGDVYVDRLKEDANVLVSHGTPSNEAYIQYMVDLKALNSYFDTMINPDNRDIEREMIVAFDSLDRVVEASNRDNVFGLYLFTTDGIRRCADRAAVDSVVSLFSEPMREHPYMVDALKNAE